MSTPTVAPTLALATIDLQGCPVGNLLDPNEPNQAVEDQYFAGWSNPLTAPARWGMPSCYRVVQDCGREVLHHINKTYRCLLAGEQLWGDYHLTASIRQLNAYSTPSSDDPHSIVARSGLMVRYQDLRQHYFSCMEGLECFALYHRKDEAWALLSDYPYRIDRARYYHLDAICQGERISM